MAFVFSVSSEYRESRFIVAAQFIFDEHGGRCAGQVGRSHRYHRRHIANNPPAASTDYRGSLKSQPFGNSTTAALYALTSVRARLTWGEALLAFIRLVKKFSSNIKRLRESLLGYFNEDHAVASQSELSHLHRFTHFWVLVARSFSKSRCPVRAAALTYTTLLALIPMLAVALGVTTSILKQQGEQRIFQFVDKFVDTIIPPAVEETNATNGGVVRVERAPRKSTSADTSATNDATTGTLTGSPESPPTASAATVDVRKMVADKINQFILKTSSGALGLTGTILLVFAAISMLSSIESTFNDIWGVVRGRSWFTRFCLYWSVITLLPILLAVAVGFTSSPYLESTKRLISSLPLVGADLLSVGFQLLPVLITCTCFSLFYMLIPNTKVHLQAALAGGVVGGLLWHLNNLASVIYVSRVVTNSKLYGGLGAVPVFMIGIYFAWLILLFGAQVAYAFQNRASYFQERQVENVNQRGREFVALRIMACIATRFQRGEPPGTVLEIATELAVPTRLVQQIMCVLLAGRLVVEVSGKEMAYAPGRPLESITCHDILTALRCGQGRVLATRDEPGRREIYGEFEQILEAERQAATRLTLLGMVNRVEALTAAEAREAKPGLNAPASPI